MAFITVNVCNIVVNFRKHKSGIRRQAILYKGYIKYGRKFNLTKQLAEICILTPKLKQRVQWWHALHAQKFKREYFTYDSDVDSGETVTSPNYRYNNWAVAAVQRWTNLERILTVAPTSVSLGRRPYPLSIIPLTTIYVTILLVEYSDLNLTISSALSP